MSSNIYYRAMVISGIVILTLGHIGVYIAALHCVISASYELPWYYASFFFMCLFSPAFSGFFCLFTNIENTLRAKIGWPSILDDSFSHMLRIIFKKGTIIPFVMKSREK